MASRDLIVDFFKASVAAFDEGCADSKWYHENKLAIANAM